MRTFHSLLVFSFITLFSLTLHAEEITVSAAASLKDAFTEAAAAFEKAHPDIQVHLNFAGSGKLMQQIVNGAPVDVFASADTLRMDKVEEAKLVLDGTRSDFAKNQLVLIVPKDSKLKVKDLKGLASADNVSKIAIANVDSVPAGRYTKIALDDVGLFDQIKPKMIPTQDVRQALDYVARGEVDAGFVYKTDAEIMKDKVKVIYVVPLKNPPIYPIAVIKTTKAPKEAKAFVKFVTGKGNKIIKKYGFTSAKKAH